MSGEEQGSAAAAETDFRPSQVPSTVSIRICFRRPLAVGLFHQAFQLPELGGSEISKDLADVFDMLSIDGTDESLSALREGDRTDSAIFLVLLAADQTFAKEPIHGGTDQPRCEKHLGP